MSALGVGRVSRLPRGRAGMTLIELLVALTIFGVIISVALTFMAQQNTAFQTALERMSALRNARYAVTLLTQDLETLGTNVPGNQPSLVYADADVVTFSADYATNVAGDPFAVFHDPGAPAGQVRAPGTSFTIPTTSVTAADTVYEVGPGIVSPAEMLTFYFAPDTTTARTDDFVLHRQINGAAAEVVARHLLRDVNAPFFSFEREVLEPDGTSALVSVPDSVLPVHHSEPLHLSPADTAASAMADSLRAVRLTVIATNGLVGEDERSVRVERRIGFPNAGRSVLSTCGSPPLFGDTLIATSTTLAGGESAVELVWGRALDEAGGEEDVVRYVLWRRDSGSSDWGEPYVAVPAGASTYTYQDATVESGTIYEFAVAAQDCTPTLSSLHSSGLVVVP
ncbi:MAG: prepilin-type N-terminal cleavage/methylation domain-containing protein [Gemmatimonadota bacterium]